LKKLFNEEALDFINSGELDDKKFIIVTDPPYNMDYHYNSYKDNLPEEDYYDLLDKVLFGRQNPFVVIHYPEALYKLAFQVGLFPEKVVSWVYNSNTPRQHRDIAFFGVKPDFTKVRQPYKNLKDKRIQERIAKGFEGSKLYDWWEINQIKNVSEEKFDHPCQIPLEVMKRIIGILPKDYIIVDPFMGTGTTGVACKELGYDFIGVEIDEKYFQIANDRINGIKPNGTLDIFLSEDNK
jgi:site-specific DNA-methyltransferase (adenine-specific)